MGKSTVLWARMTGFPYWPARPCTPLEEANLKAKAGKLKQVAVVFLGLKRDSGWVPDNGIAPFTVESMIDKFSMKKLKSDKDYRAAVIESVRIVIANGEVFPDSIMEGIQQYERNFPANPPSYCLKCYGTEISGPLMQCVHCYVTELHWHCHREDDTIPLTGSWICDKCCLVNGLPLGSLLPFEECDEESGTVAESSASASATTATPSNKRQKTNSSSNNNTSDDSGYANHILVKTKTQKGGSLLADVTAAASLSAGPSAPQTPAIDHSVEDYCFVCGQDGKLLVCDFPGCLKVYHKVCILGSYSSLSGPESGEDSHDNDSDGCHSGPMDDETFFCPRHQCIMCQSLDTTECSLSSIDLPLSYYTLTTEGLQTPAKLTQKPLKACAKCPFSICKECERDCCATANTIAGVSSSSSCNGVAAPSTGECEAPLAGVCRSVFHRPNSNGHQDDLVCLNCNNATATIQLARVLEVAWMRMCSSRLALPFLRPLLPISSDTNGTSGEATELDLLAIIYKIRQFKYDSIMSFHRDLNIIRNTLINKVHKAVVSSPEENSLFMESDANYKTIIGSFDSLMDGCSHYLRSREVLLSASSTATVSGESRNEDASKNEHDVKVESVAEMAVVDSEDYWSSCEDTTTSGVITASDGAVTGGSSNGVRSSKRLRDVAAAAGLDREAVDENSASYVAMKELMQRMWRSECGNSQLGASGTPNSGIRVTPRSLIAWAAYLNAGELSSDFRGQYDAWSVVPMIQQHSNKQHVVDLQARKRVKQMLEEAHDYTEVMNNDLLAAHYMVDMSNSHARDGISLLENFRVQTRNNPSSSTGEDTLLMLDRLKEVTQTAVQLESRLREEYLQKQHSLIHNSKEGLTIGEVSVLKELKLANDNLRWKLNYKAQVIAASQTLIGELKASLKEKDATIEQLKKELQKSSSAN